VSVPRVDFVPVVGSRRDAGPGRVNSSDHELLMRPPPSTRYSDRLK
jgi:hypothetical protein